MKTVSFNKPRPTADNAADAWVSQPTGAPEEKPAKPAAPPQQMKRLTLDVTDDLHRRVKSECAKRGVKMADLLRNMLEDYFPAKE